LIFPNEECTLIINDEKLKENIIIRSNLRRYFERFKQSYSSNYASAISNVISEHIVENTYLKEGVAFDDIRHGLYCEACRTFDLSAERYHLRCLSCGTIEKKETHLIRAISDFKYLFGKDRKSTRLNSSHVSISYAVFCLKKKKKSYAKERRVST